MPEPTKDDYMNAIYDARKARDDAEERLREAVEVARLGGLSWADIAQPLFTSRQAAQQRYGRR